VGPGARGAAAARRRRIAGGREAASQDSRRRLLQRPAPLTMLPLQLLLLPTATTASLTPPEPAQTTALRPGVPWFDTQGGVINAHGGGMLEHGGRWYWYGSRRCVNCSGTQMDGGISLYSSADLYAWQFEGIVVHVFNCTSDRRSRAVGATGYPPPSCQHGNGLDLERPKVVRCGGKFVMWVRGTGYGNTPQLVAVLTAPSPLGPFTFVRNRTGDDPFHTVASGIPNFPLGYQYADATLFQDPQSGKAFVYWRTRITTGRTGPTGFRGMELTEDCLDVVPQSDTRITATPNREGPAVFLHRGTYYLWCSGTMGWSPTNMFLYSATEPLGAFANCSNPGHGWHTYTKGLTGNSSVWNQTWAVRDGYLAAGSVWSAGGGPKVNSTLERAKSECAAHQECAGFCFNDFDRTPAPDKVLSVAFKTAVHFVKEPDDIGLQPPPIPLPGHTGNRAPEQPGLWAFDSQSTFVLANPHYTSGSKVAPFVSSEWTGTATGIALSVLTGISLRVWCCLSIYLGDRWNLYVCSQIYMGDRWNFTSQLGTSTATYVWLPLFVSPQDKRRVQVVWAESWRLNDTSFYPF
jgi:hypothetical protein